MKGYRAELLRWTLEEALKLLPPKVQNHPDFDVMGQNGVYIVIEIKDDKKIRWFLHIADSAQYGGTHFRLLFTTSPRRNAGPDLLLIDYADPDIQAKIKTQLQNWCPLAEAAL